MEVKDQGVWGSRESGVCLEFGDAKFRDFMLAEAEPVVVACFGDREVSRRRAAPHNHQTLSLYLAHIAGGTSNTSP